MIGRPGREFDRLEHEFFRHGRLDELVDRAATAQGPRELSQFLRLVTGRFLHHTRSMIIAMPCPTPMHIAHSA